MYTVNKPLNLKGRRRAIGEIVDNGDVEPRRAAFFIRNGYLSEIDSGRLDAMEGAAAPLAPPPERTGGIQIEVPIVKKEGSMVLSAAPESVSIALWLLQTAAAEAIPEIGKVEDENILIILDACDSRKTVKEAARNRAVELRRGAEQTGEGNEP